MKKFIGIVLILATLVGAVACLTACEKSEKTDKIKIVCTVFPVYDWVREIVGEEEKNVELIYLLDNGMDLHSYDPQPSDIMAISTCDLFIYVGGESEKWSEELLKGHPNQERKEMNLMDLLADKKLTEETSESMESEEEEEEGEAYDEHVWLSVRNAVFCCQKIADMLSTVDPDNASVYNQNMLSYNQKCTALDEDFTAFLVGKTPKMLLFADRFPFRYLVNDYHLSYDAAFAGCSSSSEISVATMIKLSGAIDDNDLRYVFILEGSKEENARNIINRTQKKNQEILVLDSLQTVTASQKDTKDYYSVMKNNFETLKKALA